MLIALGALVSDIGITLEGFHIFLAGFLGGGVLGLLHFARSLVHAKNEKLMQHFLAASVIGFVYAILGGIVATYFNGLSGSFVTGLTAMGLTAAVAGNYLMKEKDYNEK